MRLLVGLLVVLSLTACRQQTGWMPLTPGAHWEYESQVGLVRSVIDVQVAGQGPVGKHAGYKLESSYQPARLAWGDGALWASELGGTGFSPPVPLLTGAGSTTEWKGIVSSAGKQVSSTAKLTVADTKEKVGSKERPARQSVLLVQFGKRTVEVTTWFVEGLGIVRQEQRADGLLKSRLVYVTGP